MDALSIFCNACGRYLGAAVRCIECGWERPLTHHLPAPNTPYWQEAVTDRPHGRPLYQAGVLYTADRAGLVAAREANSGRVIWSTAVGFTPRRQLALYHNLLCVSGRDKGELLALDKADGRIVHRLPVSGGAGGPLVVGDTIYFGDAEGNVHAAQLSGTNGRRLWSTPVGQRVDYAPLLWNHLLLVATRHSNGHLIALDRRQGEIAWREPLGDRALPPVVAGSLALVGTQAGRIIAFDLRQRRRAWEYAGREQLFTGPVAAGEQLFIGDMSGRVTAVHLNRGDLLWQRELGRGTIAGLACWQGLLFVGGYQGGVIALEQASGETAWEWAAGGRISAGPVVSDEGVVYGGGATAGWFALPWHLGRWEWAAQWSERRGRPETAAPFYALSGQQEQADGLWRAQGRARLAAEMWLALGEDDRAAVAFRHAAQREQAAQPALASGLWMRAAHHFDAAGQEAEAAECRRRAGRMGRFAYLEVQPFNLPDFRAGVAGQVGFRLRNWGNDAATRIHFYLGGQLAEVVFMELERVAAGETAVVTINNLTPTRVGEQRLTVSLSYQGGGVSGNQTLYSWPIQAAEPPPGLITVQGDAGAIIVRVAEGQERPSVQVQNAGLIRYEVSKG